jgi:uncharacterized protein
VTEIFRIETAQTQLSWSTRVPTQLDLESKGPVGRLAISLSEQATDIKISRPGLPSEAANNVSVEIGPRLYEETSYDLLLRSTDNQKIELRHRDPIITHGLHASTDGHIVHGSINFKSQIGRSRFSVYVNKRLEYEFEVEVFPSKLDYAVDYYAILADVQDILAALVLEYLRSTFKTGLTLSAEIPSRLAWILLLRHVVDDLERGLRYVERHPHHGLVRERMSTRVEKLRRPDATIAKMVMQGKGQGPKSRTDSGLVLHRRLPERLARITWDTPEHRWLSSQLTLIRERLAELHLEERNRRDEQSGARQLKILDEIEGLENRITALQRLEPIAQTMGVAPPGFTSLTLQSQPGYREAHRACLILRMALRIDGGPVRLSVKDIHELYEYWCYLALVRLIGKITNQPLPARQLFSTDQHGLRIRLKQGKSQVVKFPTGSRTLELAYNPQYKGEASVFSQRPDVVLTFTDPHWPTMRLVFDAKYRINTMGSYVKRFGAPGPPQGAIDVLHRYRDAILETTGLHGSRSEKFKRTVVEGVALFPYVDTHDQFRSSQFWLSLERLGIGAVPFLPRETRYLEEWLRAVLKRGGWSTAERAIPYYSLEQLRAWQEAEKEFVLLGVLRPNAQQHLDWIKSNRFYYTPASKQPRQLVTRWLAIYSPAQIRSPGAITHLAEVQNIEIKKRREIDTPWLAQRRPEEAQVVYTLGELRELQNPIENRGPSTLGKRFTTNRWTSRLAILRATQLRELFLETSAEWRLYEQLSLAEAEFSISPGPAKLQGEEIAAGRAWFVGQHYQIQYRGPAGFLIRRDGLIDRYHSDIQEVVEIFVS